jgi:hypothetical protein
MKQESLNASPEYEPALHENNVPRHLLHDIVPLQSVQLQEFWKAVFEH